MWVLGQDHWCLAQAMGQYLTGWRKQFLCEVNMKELSSCDDGVEGALNHDKSQKTSSRKHQGLTFSSNGYQGRSEFLAGRTSLPTRDASAVSAGLYSVPSCSNERSHMLPLLAPTNATTAEPRLLPAKEDKIPSTIRLA